MAGNCKGSVRQRQGVRVANACGCCGDHTVPVACIAREHVEGVGVGVAVLNHPLRVLKRRLRANEVDPRT
jgi:hypothetical protein